MIGRYACLADEQTATPDESPITKPNSSQSPSSCSAPSVTSQVNDESGVNNLTCTIGVGHDSCEYSGGRVFLCSTGSSSMGSFSFVERSPPEMEASVPLCWVRSQNRES